MATSDEETKERVKNLAISGGKIVSPVGTSRMQKSTPGHVPGSKTTHTQGSEKQMAGDARVDKAEQLVNIDQTTGAEKNEVSELVSLESSGDNRRSYAQALTGEVIEHGESRNIKK